MRGATRSSSPAPTHLQQRLGVSSGLCLLLQIFLQGLPPSHAPAGQDDCRAAQVAARGGQGGIRDGRPRAWALADTRAAPPMLSASFTEASLNGCQGRAPLRRPRPASSAAASGQRAAPGESEPWPLRLELTPGSPGSQGRCSLPAYAAGGPRDHHNLPLCGAADEAQAGQPPHP